MWTDISRDIRAFSGADNHLCLPFEYKLDNFRVANYPDEGSLLLLQINLNGFKS